MYNIASISKDTIVIGAPSHDGRDVYDSSIKDYKYVGRGMAVVLAKNSSGRWYTQSSLEPGVANFDASFGISVDISGKKRY